jgi:predicted ATP-dependent endonuclease of OLD family
MYLKEMQIRNFRKFGDDNNIIDFAYVHNSNKTDSSSTKQIMATTLLIGQNNAGKTTIVQAIIKTVEQSFKAEDLNFKVLSCYIKDYRKYLETTTNDSKEPVFPSIIISYCFHLDLNNEKRKDKMHYIYPLINTDMTDKCEVNAYLKTELTNELEVKEKIKELILKKNPDSKESVLEYVKLINDLGGLSYKVYLDDKFTILASDQKVIRNLLSVKQIDFCSLYKSNCISDAFNKILAFRTQNNESLHTEVNNAVTGINTNINNLDFIKNEPDRINEILEKGIGGKKAQMTLHSDMSLEDLLNKNILKYGYIDEDFQIPENQYGMGYQNLMLIISEIIQELDSMDKDSFESKINMFILEEPESYMHPQMQRLLIKRIDSIVADLILANSNQEDISNFQMLITSHSSHILRGKLDSALSFDFINYLHSCGRNETRAVVLSDKLFNSSSSSNNSENANGANFIKRYFKYQAPELFFADACIVVEGQAEETLLPYFIEQEELSNCFISIFSINGAYAFKYDALFKALDIPILILTDLDIAGYSSESGNVIQCTANSQRLETTNYTLKNYNVSLTKGSRIIEKRIVETQHLTNGIYPTSFEEDLIITNKDNKDFCELLASELNEKTISSNEILSKSHSYQIRLSKKKASFSLSLLEKVSDSKLKLSIPGYIQDGLDFLEAELIKVCKIKK